MNFELIANAPTHLLVSGSALLLLASFFFLVFFFPGLRHRWRLGSLEKALNSDKYGKVSNPEQLGGAFDVFSKSDQIQHLWREHKKTLYSTFSEQGGIEVSRWHATVAAESLWNGHLAVDGRLKTDFFKHLPGIFTGLGIIGTFLGLISGLRQFEVSSQADVVRSSLETLMHSVGEAFLISAAAITAAMVVTFLEKLLLSSLYAKVNSIAQILDARFPYSAVEDILNKTEGHAEESATQLKQLKTELVKELRPLLIEISEAQSRTLERLTESLERRLEHVGKSQIDASRVSNSELGATISQAISLGLSSPLEEIKDAVKQASGDQSQSAVKMLQEVMTSFSQRLNDLFGGQISGINDLNQRTADTMQTAVEKLSELVQSLQTAGKDSTEAMAGHMAKALSDMETRQGEMARTTQALVDELKNTINASQSTTKESVESAAKEMAGHMAQALSDMAARQGEMTRTTQALVDELKNTISASQSTTKESVETAAGEMARRMAEAIEKMELRQSAINETNQEFVAQIKTLVSSSQSETNAKLQEVLGSLEVQLGKMLGSFQEIQTRAIAEGQTREQVNAEKTQTIVGSMVSSVEELVGKITEASAQMQSSVATLASTTTTAIDGMSEGAQRVNVASQNFSSASDKVTSAMGQAATVSTKLTDVSAAIATASSALQSSIGDYRLHRESVGSMVEELRGLLANAKADVSMTSDVLRRIDEATKKLSQAQLQTEEFLKGVATVLGTAHEAFRTSVTNSLSVSNHAFQEKLASAVGSVSGAIQELDGLLTTITPQGRKP